MQTGNSITLTGKAAKALGQRLRAVVGAGRKRDDTLRWNVRLAVMNGAILEVDYGDSKLMVIEKLDCESTAAPIRLEVEAGALSDVLMQAAVRKDSFVTLSEIAAAPPGGWSVGCVAKLSLKGQPVSISVPAGNLFAGAQCWDWPADWNATLAEGELERGLAATAISVSTDETRYYLQGVFFTLEGGRVRVVSTDGHRLGVVDLDSEWERVVRPQPEGAADPDWPDGSFICPARAVKVLQMLAAGHGPSAVRVAAPAAAASLAVGPDEESEIEPGAKECATISTGRWVAIVRPIDGSFPDFERVIPRKFSAQVDVDCGSLAEALAAVVSETGGKSERYRAVSLHIGPDTIELQRKVVTDSEPLESSRVVACVTAGAPPPVAGFNARYLEEFLAAVGGGNGNGLPTGRLSFAALSDGERPADHCTTPVMLQPADPDGRLGVIMPMRV